MKILQRERVVDIGVLAASLAVSGAGCEGDQVDIVEHFPPGALGEVVSLHSKFYAENWGFGLFFETKVAREMAEFADRACETDLILIARDDQGVSASMFLDLNDPASLSRGAHLRWFICADRCRGTGIGRKLMANAVAHAERECSGRMWLTTFAGLTAARHLYEDFGFTLAHEAEGEAWGTRVTEQEFRR